MRTKKPNIDDVAMLSKRSRATVDRVLNGRPGVSAKSKEAVEDAILQLGFAPSALDRRNVRVPKSLLVLLSQGSNPFFREIRRGLEHGMRGLREDRINHSFDGFDPYDPETVVHKLESVPEETDFVIVVGVDTPEVADAINALVDRGTRVVTIVSDVSGSKRAAYVGQDNFAAGKVAGRLMCELIETGPASVAVLIGHLQFRHLLDRQSGFQQALGLARPDITIIQTKPYGTDPALAKKIIRDVSKRGLSGIYLCGGGQPALIDEIEALSNPLPVVIGHEVTEKSRQALVKGTYKLVIAHDVKEIGRKAIDVCLYPDTPENPNCSINIIVTENLPAR